MELSVTVGTLKVTYCTVYIMIFYRSPVCSCITSTYFFFFFVKVLQIKITRWKAFAENKMRWKLIPLDSQQVVRIRNPIWRLKITTWKVVVVKRVKTHRRGSNSLKQLQSIFLYPGLLSYSTSTWSVFISMLLRHYVFLSLKWAFQNTNSKLYRKLICICFYYRLPHIHFTGN